jgi:hypothetical protein
MEDNQLSRSELYVAISEAYNLDEVINEIGYEKIEKLVLTMSQSEINNLIFVSDDMVAVKNLIDNILLQNK